MPVRSANRTDSSGGELGLLADENEDSGRERQNAHDYGRNGDTCDERHYANENEVNRQQEQTEIFLEVHDVSLSLGDDVDLSYPLPNVTTKSAAELT